MNKSNTLLPILAAGLLAAAGAQAQSISASGSSDDPPKAGEASTQTMGAPNAKTTNSPYTEAPLVTTPAPAVVTTPAVVTKPAVVATSTTTVSFAPVMRSPTDELMTRRARFEAQRRAMLHGDTRYTMVNGDLVIQQ